MPVIRETPARLTHADTILYEVYMLRFSIRRLMQHDEQGDWEDQKDAWGYLEVFLLHYRNLIEFLGKTKRRLRKKRTANASAPLPSSVFHW